MAFLLVNFAVKNAMFNLNENNRFVMAQHPSDMRIGVYSMSGQVRAVGAARSLASNRSGGSLMSWTTCATTLPLTKSDRCCLITTRNRKDNPLRFLFFSAMSSRLVSDGYLRYASNRKANIVSRKICTKSKVDY